MSRRHESTTVRIHPNELAARMAAPAVLEVFTPEEVRALLDVAEDMETGRITSTEVRMDTYILTTKCGTVACIAGHTAIRLGRPHDLTHRPVRAWIDEVWHRPGADILARPLFIPWTVGEDSFSSNPNSCAHAIRTFVATGVPEWRAA